MIGFRLIESGAVEARTAVAARPAEQALLVRGGSSLSGGVDVYGSKKAAAKLLIATLLSDEPCRVLNIPRVDDVIHAARLVACFGRFAEIIGERDVRIAGAAALAGEPCHGLAALAGQSRIPVLAAGPQLARFGEAWVPPLGGDRIGARPVDQHLLALKRFGAEVSTAHGGWIRAIAKSLRPADISLPFPMVGVTEQVLLTAASVEGRSHLHSAALDPEVMELVAALRLMGARIDVDAGSRTLAIEGSTRLGGFSHRCAPDRIEVGSWASAALATGGEIEVRGSSLRGMGSFLAAYCAAGGKARATGGGVRFGRARGRSRCDVRVETGPYPAFESDWQSPMLVAMTQIDGIATVHETMFERRMMIVEPLRAAGADVSLEPCERGRGRCGVSAGRPHLAVVRGRSALRPLDLRLDDIRGGFGLLLAALCADGESRLRGATILDRGYENLAARLRGLGGEVEWMR